MRECSCILYLLLFIQIEAAGSSDLTNTTSSDEPSSGTINYLII